MSEFLTLCRRVGFTRQRAITFFGISPEPYHNWAKRGAPAHVYAVLELLTGDLSRHGFPQWRIRKGQLFAPSGVGFSPGEIEAIPMKNTEIALYRSTNDKLRKQISPAYERTKLRAANEDRYRPEQLPIFSTEDIFLSD